ncbi:MAG: type II toxin-antitoxin system VapC family toxin [Elusimicrobia bacterium]|nr:type II toxin-antitoxin system VapC family toxin [Elusimicrobiota bacterium]
MKYLLDASALSELLKPRPAARVVRWLDERDEASLYLSVVTIGELHKGIAGMPAGPRKARLRDWVDEELSKRFHGRILELDLETAGEWGRLQARAARRGKTLDVIDSLIAATATARRLTVVTRNVKGLRRCGAEVFDPWTG